jgi:hypothetical protein
MKHRLLKEPQRVTLSLLLLARTFLIREPYFAHSVVIASLSLWLSCSGVVELTWQQQEAQEAGVFISVVVVVAQEQLAHSAHRTQQRVQGICRYAPRSHTVCGLFVHSLFLSSSVDASTSTRQLVRQAAKAFALTVPVRQLCVKVDGSDASGAPIDGLLDESMTMHETDAQLVAEGVTFRYILTHDPLLGTSAAAVLAAPTNAHVVADASDNDESDDDDAAADDDHDDDIDGTDHEHGDDAEPSAAGTALALNLNALGADNALSVPSMLSPRVLKSDTIRLAASEKQRRRRRGGKDAAGDDSDALVADDEDEKREPKTTAWTRFEERLRAAAADESDALRHDLFKARRGADIELVTHRRRPRLPDGELMGDIKRKDAAMALHVDVFKRDWEMLQFNNRPVSEQLGDADELAPPLPFADLRSWLEPIKPPSPRTSVKDVELHKELVLEKGKWLSARVEADTSVSFLASFVDAPTSLKPPTAAAAAAATTAKSSRHSSGAPGSGALPARQTAAFAVPRLQPSLVTCATSRAMRVLVEPIDLRFELPPVEPLYVQLQVYNLRERRRMSEVHYMHVEYNTTMLDMAANGSAFAPETRLQKAILTIDDPSPDVYIVLRMFCILRPDEDPHEPYYGSNKQVKTKEMAALVSKANDYCVRYGAYCQPFAFGAVPLLTDTGELPAEPVHFENLQPIRSTFDALLERFYQESASSKRGKIGLASLLSKDKTLNGRFTMRLSAVAPRELAAMRGRLSPSLVPLKPLAEPDTDHRSMRSTSAPMPFVREVQQIPSDTEQLAVVDEFVHNLYVNLEQLNLTSLPSAANKMSIAVQMEVKVDDADVMARGEKVIYGRGSEPLLVNRVESCVSYNTKKPVLVDEFKIRLPTGVGGKYNLLFTFFNVGIKKGEDATRTPVAYAFLPLFDARGKLLADGQHHMMVYDAIHSTYMSQTPKAFDKKPLFVVSTFLLSSLRGTSDALHRFTSAYGAMAAQEGSRAGGATELQVAHNALRSAPAHELVRLHPVLLNQLLAIMCDARHGEVARDAFVSFMFVVDTVASATSTARTVAGELDSRTGRNATLDSYTHHFFATPDGARHTVHEMLVRRIADTSRTQEAQHIQLELYGWFLFDLIVKSIARRIGNAELADDANRGARLAADGEQAQLLADLRPMVEALALQVKNNTDLQDESARLLNRALAFFLLDLLSLLDRGAVFCLIDRYFTTLDAHSRYLPLVRLKVTCLRIFNMYEHYLLVNLPVATAFDAKRSRDLLARFWKQHFLVGLQLAEVRQCLDYRQKEIRLLAANALLEQLAYLDGALTPPRHQRVVDMFFPYVPLLLERVEFIRSLGGRTLGGAGGGGGGGGGGDGDMATAAASAALTAAAAKTSQKPPEHLHELRTWLAAWLFLCRDCTPALLRDFLLAQPAATRARFFEILATCVTNFQGCHLNVVREVTRVALIAIDMQLAPNVGTREPDAGVEGAFNVLVLLLKANAYDAESLGLAFVAVRQFIHQFPELLFQSSSECLTYCAALCLELLNLCDSLEPKVRNKAAALLYVLMRANWRATDETNFYRARMQTLVAVSKLTSRGAIDDYTRVNSALQAVSNKALEEFPPRAAAGGGGSGGGAASGARDVRAMSFATTLESKRLQTSQTSLAASAAAAASAPAAGGDEPPRLSGPMLSLSDDENLSFGEQVELLVMRMFAVIRDNQNIALNRDDPELTTDLYYQVACNYTEMPVLRVTWLDNLAAHQVAHGNHAEAAQCKLYMAYLVALHLCEQRSASSSSLSSLSSSSSSIGGVPTSADAFRLTAPNLAREPANPKLKYQEGMYDSPTFTMPGLLRTLTTAIEYLKNAQMYEAAIDVHSILVAIYRDRGDYAALQRAFAAMSAVCASLVELTRVGRFFPCYYRVAFYGKRFGAFDRKQFVYRESFDVKSGDITERLRQQFGRKFGGDTNIEILPNKPVDLKALDKKKCYLQLATLAPYEAGTPPVNVARFMMQVPFTKESGSSGKERTHGGVASQFIRRTIYTCEGTFPWINKRQFIASAEEIELTPVQNAVELVQNQTRDLRAVCALQPVNRQALQMMLQGSVVPQVHGGTLEVAEAFFGKSASRSVDKGDLAKLAQQLGEFLHECRPAIDLNRRTALELAPPPAAPIGGGQKASEGGAAGAAGGGSSSGSGIALGGDGGAAAAPVGGAAIAAAASTRLAPSGSPSAAASAADLHSAQQDVKFQAQLETSFNALVSKLATLLPPDVKLPATFESTTE